MNKKFVKGALFFSIAILVFDLIYKTVFQINYLTRDKCLFYQLAPKPVFLLYKSFGELLLLVFVGAFLAFYLEEKFSKHNNLYPKNVFVAFIYASLMPICSCMAIPMIWTMRKKISLKIIITFIVAAPILSPQIIILSLISLGPEYTVLRIVFAFVVSILTGTIIEGFYQKNKLVFPKLSCTSCEKKRGDIYEKTIYLFKQLLPFVFLAGIINIILETIDVSLLLSQFGEENIFSTTIILLTGIPLYLCGGTEIILLRPFINHGLISLGTALGFSITSTAICISSILMLSRLLGKKTALLITFLIFIISLILSLIVIILI